VEGLADKLGEAHWFTLWIFDGGDNNIEKEMSTTFVTRYVVWIMQFAGNLSTIQCFRGYGSSSNYMDDILMEIEHHTRLLTQLELSKQKTAVLNGIAECQGQFFIFTITLQLWCLL
jgi:hypothetical protein